MKTIAITIEEDMLARIDRLASGDSGGPVNRSQFIRAAVREYVRRLEEAVETQREAAILRRHRGRLAQQTRALVREQAKP